MHLRHPRLLLALGLLLGAGLPAAGQEAAQPDLAPAGLAAAPGNLTAGLAAVFHLEVRNAGNATSAPANVSFFVDGALLGNASLTPVLNGTSGNVTSPPWTAALGNHTVLAVVDPEGAVAEENETNNEARLELRVGEAPAEKPDLLLLDVGPSAPPALGQNVTFQARVLNAGAGDAGRFAVRFEVDGKALGNATTPLLPAGQGATLKSPAWFVTGGEHTIRAVADGRHEVEETEEANNDFQRPFTAAPPRFEGPDLRVSDVLLEPMQPLLGAQVVFRAVVENPGQSSGAFLVVFTMDNRTLSSQRIPSLAANGSRVVNSSAWNATAGDHELRVEVDAGPGNDTALTDNVLPVRFRVPDRTARPDLVVDLVTLPAVIAPGQAVQGAVVVRNNGTWASPASAVRFTLDGVAIGDVALPGLEPGETARVDSPRWNATLGQHVLLAKVNPAAAIPELRGDNNALARNVTVPHGLAGGNASALPDLAGELSWDPVQPRAGQEVVLRAALRNAGNGTLGAFTVEFLVDGQVHDGQEVPGIGALEVVMLSRPWMATPGRHTFGLRLDGALEHHEQEEANNLAYAAVDVPAQGIGFARDVPGPALPLGLAALALLALARRPRR